MLKLHKNDISCQLSISFLCGVFPSMLKINKFIPINKKDSKLDFSNYYPIFLLSNLDKILEELVCKTISKIFSDSNFIYPLQLGFREKYSTTHALISPTKIRKITKNLDQGNTACGIFVDLQKAFDIIEHDILLAELEYHGV